jgi:aldehyde dehydrogenase (NAD+)
MAEATYTNELVALRKYFESGLTRSYAFRKEQLKNLKRAILDHEDELYEALHSDLKKNREECWITELGMVISEINAMMKNLRRWMEPERVPTNLLNLPSGSRVTREPLGIVLVIAPWNYPFQLLINPLVGAIAAGNCAVLKPSEFAPATDRVMKKMIEKAFPTDYILYAQGEGSTVIPAMMNEFRFDHVFYTGSTAVGRIIYKMAAEKLVPVTLELGGKSPCVVERDANITVAARRIAVTKFSNAGQMCVAPDYVLVHDSRKEELIAALQKATRQFYSDRPYESDEYGKIINTKQFDRLTAYLPEGTIVQGGRRDRDKLYLEPTVLTNVSPDATIMKEEIFGPLLPVFGFTETADAMTLINRNPNPLAFYIFTSSKTKEREWLERVPAGGACVNNTALHFTNHDLPFGGRGFSGMGSYHGKYSFEAFSHRKSILKTPTWLDPGIKYPPFKGRLNLLKWIIR